MEFFDFLENMSPWWWVAIGIGLGAVEMATFSFFLIWPALAALVMAGLVAYAPGMPGEIILAVFAALSVILTFAGRALVRQFGDGGGPETTLNDRGARMLGRRGSVIGHNHGEIRVEIDGVHWSARATTQGLSVGTGVEVTGVDGQTLEVRALEG